MAKFNSVYRMAILLINVLPKGKAAGPFSSEY